MVCAVTRDLNRYLAQIDQEEAVERFADEHEISYEEAEKQLQDQRDEFLISKRQAYLEDFVD